ncbi:MAG: transglutaminase, partial [Myxococcales bacterium]|nr:transglutaminase [Myxococcales bacterium]
VIVMVPVGTIIILVFRNVIGFRTFGTFLPTLVAASMRHTGLLWGMIGFLGLIIVVALIRKAAARLELLHSPQLAALLTAVIGLMLLLAWYAAEHDLPRLARVTLFPFAITAITAERFAIVWDEEGASSAWKTLLRTAIVVAFCYATMNSLSLQILMLAFPELLLLVMAIDIWLGRWVGLRMTEWIRFRGLLAAGRTP